MTNDKPKFLLGGVNHYVEANVLHSGITVSEFEHKSHNYVQFCSYTFVLG